MEADLKLELRGPVGELFLAVDDPSHPYRKHTEVLVEGAANTGKSMGIGHALDKFAITYPGCRMLFLRQTRRSLTESFLVTWEEKVLWPGHPAIHGNAKRGNRHDYLYPYSTNVVDGVVYEGSTHIVLAGMDDPGKVLSTEFDLIYWIQAEEGFQQAWLTLKTRVRNKRAPWQLLIGDVNPADMYHHLNVRAGTEYMLRLKTEHKHNPGFTEADQEALDSLPPGPLRDRLRDGKWVSAAGLIYTTWDPERHFVTEDPGCDWYFATFDQGTRHPGCLQVWGVKDGALYRVAEIYFTAEGIRQRDPNTAPIDWWAERVLDMDDEYGLVMVWCDHDPDYVRKFNDILNRKKREEDQYPVARNANKSLLPGIQMVQWALDGDEDGPRMFVVRDAFPCGLDPTRAPKPQCFEHEIGAYVWILSEEGKPVREMPDPTCADHAMDGARYATMGFWNQDHTPLVPPKSYAPGTYGDWLGFADEEEGSRFDVE